MNSGQVCRPCRGSCNPIPGRGCFGDLPGDKIVVSPPSPIFEPLVDGGDDSDSPAGGVGGAAGLGGGCSSGRPAAGGGESGGSPAAGAGSRGGSPIAGVYKGGDSGSPAAGVGGAGGLRGGCSSRSPAVGGSGNLAKSRIGGSSGDD